MTVVRDGHLRDWVATLDDAEGLEWLGTGWLLGGLCMTIILVALTARVPVA